MESFDIQSLLSFTPATRFCQKCYGLHVNMPVDDKYTKMTCRVCGLEYIATSGPLIVSAKEYFKSHGLTIEFRDVIAHCRSLANIAYKMSLFSSPLSNHLCGALLAAAQSALEPDIRTDLRLDNPGHGAAPGDRICPPAGHASHRFDAASTWPMAAGRARRPPRPARGSDSRRRARSGCIADARGCAPASGADR